MILLFEVRTAAKPSVSLRWGAGEVGCFLEIPLGKWRLPFGFSPWWRLCVGGWFGVRSVVCLGSVGMRR